MAIRRPPEREPHASDCISRRVVSVVNVSPDAAVDLFRHQSWLRFSVFCCYLTVLSTRTCVCVPAKASTCCRDAGSPRKCGVAFQILSLIPSLAICHFLVPRQAYFKLSSASFRAVSFKEGI